MRRQEGCFAGLLIIEALDEASLRSALRKAAELAPDVLPGAGDPEVPTTLPVWRDDSWPDLDSSISLTPRTFND